ncbi:MAG TPA: alanine racemase [Steroidobacter sp.]|uniref:alanine racemase n=1 Tax=Steroidobacter sp. TaxID=1978227 RepID=UPI002EDA1C0E
MQLQPHREDDSLVIVEAADGRSNRFTLDAAAFEANVSATRRLLPPATKLFQVVKGNGYGLGLERVIALGRRAGVDGFCAGTPSEALRAKRLAPDLPILLFPSCAPSMLPALAEAGVVLSINSEQSFVELMQAGVNASVFFKLECGLGRYGLDQSSVASVLGAYRRQSRIRCIGVYSHFGSGDDELLDAGIARFENFLTTLKAAVPTPLTTMIASSPTILRRPQLGYTAVDPGRLLYGLVEEAEGIRPVLRSVASTLLQVTMYASTQTVHVGYANRIELPPGGRTGVFPLGWLDGLSTGGFEYVLVRGVRVPVIGRTLLHSIVDLSAVAEAEVGDEVVLIGQQRGERLTLADLARSHGVSPIELHFRLLGAIGAE